MTIPELLLENFSSEPDSRIVRCHSRMRMTIYPHDNDPVFPDRSTLARTITFSDTEIADFSLRRFNWTKNLGKAAGQWQALIRTDERIGLFNPMNGDILPGDWIEIELLRNGIPILICLGVIDTINRDRRSIGGASSVHWQITGRDHGKIFDHPITYSNMFAQSLGEVVKGLMTERVKGKIGGSPAEMFKILIEAAFTQGTTSSIWRLPPALAEATRGGFASENPNILDLLQIQNDRPTEGHYYNEVQLWNKAGQTLYQALAFWCFPLMHRLLFDVSDPIDPDYDSQYPITASIRQHPYINLEDGLASDWFELPFWEIPSWLPISDNLARSDNERFNIIQLLSNCGWEGSASEQSITALPYYGRASTERHGLRPMQENTHFLASEGADISGWRTLRGTQQKRLMEWHAGNPYFLSGQINLPIPLPEARIGHILSMDNGTPADSLTSYIEGVSLEYRASTNEREAPKATSSLTVTRGYKGTDRDALRLIQNAASGYEELKFQIQRS